LWSRRPDAGHGASTRRQLGSVSRRSSVASLWHPRPCIDDERVGIFHHAGIAHGRAGFHTSSFCTPSFVTRHTASSLDAGGQTEVSRGEPRTIGRKLGFGGEVVAATVGSLQQDERRVAVVHGEQHHRVDLAQEVPERIRAAAVQRHRIGELGSS
jgi:hypothetical protein